MKVNSLGVRTEPLIATQGREMKDETKVSTSLERSIPLRDEVDIRGNEEDRGILFSDDERLRIERQIGEKVAREVERKYGVCADPVLNERAERALKRLLPYFKRRAEITPEIKVLNTKMINAFSVPGGHIYVTKGIMELMNDDELLFVVGHELGHLDRGHAMKRLERTLTLQVILGTLLGGGLATHLMMSIYNMLVESAFSRDNEYEADNEGLRYVIKAGADPEVAVSAMRKLQKLEREKPNLIERLLRDHPPTDKRIAKLERWIAEYRETGVVPHES